VTPSRLWGSPDPVLPREWQGCCVCGLRAEHRAFAAPHSARHSGGDRQMGHVRKLKGATRCYKMVRNARGDTNCARAPEGGGRGEMLVLLSVLNTTEPTVTSFSVLTTGKGLRRVGGFIFFRCSCLDLVCFIMAICRFRIHLFGNTTNHPPDYSGVRVYPQMARYEAGLAINCHQPVPARGGVN
jgi:hypothetical protein